MLSAILSMAAILRVVTCEGVAILDMPSSNVKVVEQGSDVIFHCTHVNSSVQLVWSFNETDIPDVSYSLSPSPTSSLSSLSSLPSLSRVVSVNGSLHIHNCSVMDSGIYACREEGAVSEEGGGGRAEEGDQRGEEGKGEAVGPAVQVEIQLEVYVMPDYSREWLVVGVTGGVVTAVLLAGLAVTHAREKKRLRMLRK